MTAVRDALDMMCSCGHPTYEHQIVDNDVESFSWKELERRKGCTICLCRVSHFGGDCTCHTEKGELR